MKQDTLELFKTLTELQGAPGSEHLVSNFMKKNLEKYADDVIQDNLGGVFGVKNGEGPRVMVAGHMDEVGFKIGRASCRERRWIWGGGECVKRIIERSRAE